VTSNLLKWDYVVVGGGLFGVTVAKKLAMGNHNVALIEENEKLATQLEGSVSIRDFENLKVIYGHGFFDEAGQVVVLDPETGDEQHVVSAGVSIIACGELTSFLGLAKLGVVLDEHLRIPVDASFQTSAPGIYAVGECSPLGSRLPPQVVAEQIAASCVQDRSFQ